MNRTGPLLLARAGGLGLLLWLAAPVARAAAHGNGHLTPQTVWSAWSWEPLILLGLGLAGWRYAAGVGELWRRAGRGTGVQVRQALSFAAGLLFLFIALVSPVDALGESLFSAHMVQHMLLIFAAAPLLVLGAPPVALAFMVPGPWRVGLARWWHRQGGLRRAGGLLLHPAVVWGLHAGLLWLWHAPGPYMLAVENDIIHILEHACFLIPALLFWWMVVESARGRQRAGMAILYLFTMGLQGGLLGALITFSPQPWYPIEAEAAAAWNLSPLDDQHLAGVIMWVPAGLVYMGAALGVMGAWLLAQEETSPPGPLSKNRKNGGF